MTEASLELKEFAEKHLEGDLLRQLGQFVLRKLMEVEVEAKVGAVLGERTEDRMAHRNGYRDRSLGTRIGELNLKIPKLREGSYFTSFLEPRRCSEHALVAVIQEANIQGVSTRKVEEPGVNAV